MMKEELQSFIYIEKLLAQMYRMAAPLATMQEERNTLLSFASDAEQNANFLNYFYKQEFGTNFDPMIPEGIINGSFRDVLREIQRQELTSYLQFRKQLYRQQDYDFRQTMQVITDKKLGHILTIMAIISDMDNQVN